MPKLKNGRQKKSRLVVAMRPVTAKSPRLQKKNKNAASDLSAVGIEGEGNIKGGKTLRSTRNKPAKFADEDPDQASLKKTEKSLKQQQKAKNRTNQRIATKKVAKKAAKATKPVKKPQTVKRKAPPKSKSAKKKKTISKPEAQADLQIEVASPTEAEHAVNEFEEISPDVLQIIPEVTKSPAKPAKEKAKPKMPAKRKKVAPKPPKPPKQQKVQIVEEIVQEEQVPIIIKREDDDEDEIEEDDEDMDDSLFFGLPPEHPPPLASCSHCKRKFKKEDLPDHMASCPERYVQCRECGKVLSNLQTLERHHKRFHLKLREVPCTLCDKMFIDEAAARKHLKTVHFKVKNFHCPHCDKSFSQRNKLTYHVRTHSGEKPFSCTECGRSFSLLWNLKTHLRTHTGEKPYACDVCGRKFTQKQNMTSHMTTHKKPKISKSAYASAYHGGSSDGSEYFSSSTLHDVAKSSILQKSYSLEDKTSAHTRSLQQNIGAGQYLLDNMASIVSTTGTRGAGTSVASMVHSSSLLNLENGLGLLSAVARKGDVQEQPGSSVQVDGIISMADQSSSSSQAAQATTGLEQVVEVLIQSTGGNSEGTSSENVGAETIVATSDVGSRQEVTLESQEVLGDLETHIIAQDQKNALSQQGTTQTVIPIGNANLSGLANILQNPEVLAAINAAAASNKFIVIGPVGMLSGQGTSSVSTMSTALPDLQPGNITVGTDGEATVMSTGLDAAENYVMQGISNQINVSDMNTNVSSSIQVEVSSVQDTGGMILPSTSVTTSSHTLDMPTSEAVRVVNASIEPLVSSGMTAQESASVSSVISSDVGSDTVSSGETYSAVSSQPHDMTTMIQSGTGEQGIGSTQVESFVSSVTMSNSLQPTLSSVEATQSSSLKPGLEAATSSENLVSSGDHQADINVAESSEESSNVSRQREAVTSFSGDIISGSSTVGTINQDESADQNVTEEVSSSGDRGQVRAYPEPEDGVVGSAQIHQTTSVDQGIVQRSTAAESSLASSPDNVGTNSTDVVEPQTVQSSNVDAETFQPGADSTDAQNHTNEAVTSEIPVINQPDDAQGLHVKHTLQPDDGQGLHVSQTLQPNNSNIEEVDVSQLSGGQVIQLDLSTAAALQASGLINTTQSLVMMTNDGTSYTVTLPEGFVSADSLSSIQNMSLSQIPLVIGSTLAGIQSDEVSGITTSSSISSSIQTVDTTQGSGGIQSVSASHMPIIIDNGVTVGQEEMSNAVSSGSSGSGTQSIDAVQGSSITHAYSTVFQEANKAADHDLAVMQEPEQIDSSDSASLVTNSGTDNLNQNTTVSETEATGVTSSVENVGMALPSVVAPEQTSQEENQISTSAHDVN